MPRSNCSRREFSIWEEKNIGFCFLVAPWTIAYQRFASGVNFIGEKSIVYNPSYFFVHIVNQKDSYEQMHKELKSVQKQSLLIIDCLQLSVVFTIMRKCPMVLFLVQANFVWWNVTNGIELVLFDWSVGMQIFFFHQALFFSILDNEQVQLILVDTGEISKVKMNSVVRLMGKFTLLPCQSVACSLSRVGEYADWMSVLSFLEILPLESDGWTRSTLRCFHQSFEQQGEKSELNIRVTNNDGAHWPMIFVDISTNKIQVKPSNSTADERFSLILEFVRWFVFYSSMFFECTN